MGLDWYLASMRSPEPVRPPAAAAPRSQRRQRLVRLSLVLCVLLVVVVVGEAAFWMATLGNIQRFDIVEPPDDGVDTFLLVGSDSRSFVATEQDRSSFGDDRGVPGERADLLLVVQVDQDGGATLWSLPRDLLVELPEGGRTRLALSLDASPQALADAICFGLGIGVDHMLISTFDGLRGAVDAVGGIDVDVESPVRDPMTGLHLGAAGSVHLDGDMALAYARARNAEVYAGGEWLLEADGPVARQARATQVLSALDDAVRSNRWPSLTFHRVARSVSGSLRVDSTTGREDLMRLLDVLGQDAGATWRTVSVDAAQVGEVPLAELNATGRAELASLGTYPAPCRS